MAVFDFQNGGRRHLGFLKLEIFLILVIGTVNIVELRHRAKFRRNRSNRGRDLAIFRFFKMAAAAILNFQNMEILGAEMVKTAFGRP